MSVWMGWKERIVNVPVSEASKDGGVRFISIIFSLKSGPLNATQVQCSENPVWMSDARCLLVADKDNAAEPEEERGLDSLSSVKRAQCISHSVRTHTHTHTST